MEYITYVIKDPRDNAPIYVGQTHNFDKRKKKYFSKIRKDKLPKIDKINITVYFVKLKRLGFDPVIEVVDMQDTEENSLNSETKWVRTFVLSGYPLLNRWREHRSIVKEKFSSDFLKQYFSDRLI